MSSPRRYLLLLFAFAAGIKSLAGDECSEWLESCPGAQATALEPSELTPPDKDRRPEQPMLR